MGWEFKSRKSQKSHKKRQKEHAKTEQVFLTGLIASDQLPPTPRSICLVESYRLVSYLSGSVHGKHRISQECQNGWIYTYIYGKENVCFLPVVYFKNLLLPFEWVRKKDRKSVV